MSTIFIDTETTGLSHEHDEVLEISIINQDGDILLDTLVKPVKKATWPEAQAIHGISPESIAIVNPPTLIELAPTIASILNEHDSAVVYNLDYDRPFILNAIHSDDQDLKAGIDWQCAMLEFANIYGEWDHRRDQYKWQKLTVAADHVGHEWQGQAHRALADCQATLSVWKWTQSTEYFCTELPK